MLLNVVMVACAVQDIILLMGRRGAFERVECLHYEVHSELRCLEQ